MTVESQARKPKCKKIGVIIYDDFETLDVFGPVQMWGRLPDHEVVFVSEDGRPVRSAQGFSTPAAFSFETVPQLTVLMVPGGQGSRTQVDNLAMLTFLQRQSRDTEWTISVCTGSALLAKAGILDEREATTNKVAFEWVSGQSERVRWRRKARWVSDGKFMTSSGVSAGTDLALAFVEKLHGRKMAENVAKTAEYRWNDDPGDDPFADVAR